MQKETFVRERMPATDSWQCYRRKYGGIHSILVRCLTENGNGDIVMGYGLRPRFSMELTRQMSLCLKDTMP